MLIMVILYYNYATFTKLGLLIYCSSNRSGAHCSGNPLGDSVRWEGFNYFNLCI